MNIAVINIKDIVKYLIKICIIFFLIYICMQVINLVKTAKKSNINENIENGIDKISKNSFTEVLDISIPLFSYKNINESKNIVLSNKDILALETGIFDESIFNNTDLVINEEDLTVDDIDEVKESIDLIPKDVVTEEITENNIVAKVTGSYGNVKINNQSDYEITEEMLIPDVEITNKKDILIYHTHTCESYTPSPRI